MLITLGLVLLILIMVVGGDRGVVSLIALCGNLLILSLAIWLIASGVPVLLVTVCVGVVISCITLFYQNGRNGKTWSAFLATMITMLLLFFFIYIVVWRSEAGGLNEIQQVGEDVFYYNMNLNISMKSHKEDMTFKELIHSGMQIGKEVTGTTVNTLLFAYLGESLLLFSYLRMQGYSFELLLNSKIMFENCASMIFGAIACVVVMPVAAVAGGYFFRFK